MLMDVPAERMTPPTTLEMGRAPMAFLSSEGDLFHHLEQLAAPPDYSVTGEVPLGPLSSGGDLNQSGSVHF